ncbi:D-alanine--D-alanine ligase [Thaumasiovibrio subtropicus]|uniref:D-alanine--D-alanine ligase n=1 Tax=Thaumasiovibrio subtropicus TaxID=1891207 RepID=UPI000B35ED36|nr:D-alanine--D-alanine ligase [Thaumasiovibrio subtropicus]
MSSKQILLLCGGGGAEHEVSLVSASYVQSQLEQVEGFDVVRVEIKPEGWMTEQGQACQLGFDRVLSVGDRQLTIDAVVPVVHGFPGETGDLQSFFELIGLPYIGCDAEASKNCFNKITTKLWFDTLHIPNTPYYFMSEFTESEIAKAEAALVEWGSIFVKAASQGSSIGCYKVSDVGDLRKALQDAFSFSNQVLIEKAVKPRELEIAAYEYDGDIVVTVPGEVVAPGDTFYTYEEKYSNDSHSTTVIKADISDAVRDEMMLLAKRAFEHMKLRDLSRIDFFLTEDNEVLLNEINTFPGMTPISMFPKMLTANGHDIQTFFAQAVHRAIEAKAV